MNAKRFTLPKKEIIKKSKEITEIIKNSNSVAGDLIKIYFRLLSNRDIISRVAFAVSKKVKPVVLKNRAKRLLREVYRLNKHKLIDLLSLKNKSIDMVMIFIADKELIKKLKYIDVERDFLQLMEKILKVVNET
ncbi:ribonuclease P protein component [Candidatus Kryptonium thompsonii]|uniref:Ribonuclease P protein component n=1 Tax=Candidatus Kryptonium thompsonii TaxID=1633631 RepID=A0A0P1LU77_9BACT|nr:ribonuclease P protein component [Candidatus Kryptonium thompsoni]CUS77167.1 ribonuclease P protein component [Candidatus Kryptonium thompsoni]CUS79588.1 ribonuclease P protein component [Candidatus Kryptonium thompsoni]CUS81163.1 ribonuclease P protein component [Candidatus Kryptonium thompsoni]CUS82905.1 ribonuclease P protein component [Candidatus Kryptonium thompsoni]CUS85337.1 ribonuclease P protein component [Candidatus Kryptonium thompsoni]